MLFTGILLIGCGSADTDFGATASTVVDAGADARASGGAAGSGGSTSTDSGAWPLACGPRIQCQSLTTASQVKCAGDADCCRGTRCIPIGNGSFCGPTKTFYDCNSDEECPCLWSCAEADGARACRQPRYR